FISFKTNRKITSANSKTTTINTILHQVICNCSFPHSVTIQARKQAKTMFKGVSFILAFFCFFTYGFSSSCMLRLDGNFFLCVLFLVKRTFKIRIFFSFLCIDFPSNGLPLLKIRLLYCNFFWYFFNWNGLADELFYFLDIIFFCRVTKSNCITFIKGTSCPANAMHIILDDNRNIKVKYMAYIGYIQSTCGHIRGNQNPDMSFLERINGIDAGVLPFICMDDPYIILSIFPFQKMENIVGHSFGLAKNNNPVKGFIVLQQMLQQI